MTTYVKFTMMSCNEAPSTPAWSDKIAVQLQAKGTVAFHPEVGKMIYLANGMVNSPVLDPKICQDRNDCGSSIIQSSPESKMKKYPTQTEDV